ncbi:MAG: hypothetical protein WD739_11885 [Actinomycetota bacterium]
MNNKTGARGIETYARARQRSGDLWGWEFDPESEVVELFTNMDRDHSSFPDNIGGVKVVITPLPAAREQEEQ